MRSFRTCWPKFTASLTAFALVGCSDTRIYLPSKAEKIAERSRAELALGSSPSPEHYLSLGLAEAGLGKHEEAIRNFLKASELNPTSFVAYSQLCQEFNLLSRAPEAIQYCKVALRLDPGNRVARNGLEFAQRAQAQANVKQGPELIARGLEQYSKGDMNGAIDTWNKIPSESPQYAAARNNLATALIGKKEFHRARMMLSEALNLEPNNELFQNNVRWLERESAQAP